ncbi:MAG TPA: serine/threonine-protein kinase, partial [Aggregatilineales bacterium]|nr:serine/threonine-protein kinase [Aggregatilineales bacterium]
MSEERHDPLIGKRLGDYTLSRLIAKGGMGRVYVADDSQLGRQVAVKVITLDEDLADEIMERFQREAQVIGRLDDHPNIITIHRYGKEKGHHYIAMKYIRGQSLADYLELLRTKKEFIEWDEMLPILRQVAAALDYAHIHGVIHRDIKPANIMLDQSPSQPGQKIAILMDFGLVMQLDNNMTSGTAFGTPRYIAPEQAISSTDACAQSDIYSLGVVVFEMLAGQTPFDSDDSPVAVALSHVTKQPPSPRLFRPDLPESVVPVIMKVLAKKPEDRYQTTAGFVDALQLALIGKLPDTNLIVAPRREVVIEPDRPTMQVDVLEFQDDDDTEVPRPEVITG